MYKNYIILDILKKEYGTLSKLRKYDAYEIGCYTGNASRFFCNFLKTYIATDINKIRISEAQKLTHSLY